LFRPPKVRIAQVLNEPLRDGISMQIDAAQVESLIRKVVGETLARLELLGGRPAGQASSSATPVAISRLLMKPREASAALGISERTLWDLTHQNVIPHVRIGRAVRYDPADLRAWINANKNRRGVATENA
jgi:excisionase family DNA binding protein